MFKAHRHLRALVAVGVLAAAPACASGALYRYPAGAQRVDERAYRNGYNEGRNQGENDARRNRPFDYRRHGDFRNADDGYRGYGNRNAYREAFRQGFVDG